MRERGGRRERERREREREGGGEEEGKKKSRILKTKDYFLASFTK